MRLCYYFFAFTPDVLQCLHSAHGVGVATAFCGQLFQNLSLRCNQLSRITQINILTLTLFLVHLSHMLSSRPNLDVVFPSFRSSLISAVNPFCFQLTPFQLQTQASHHLSSWLLLAASQRAVTFTKSLLLTNQMESSGVVHILHPRIMQNLHPAQKCLDLPGKFECVLLSTLY